MDRLVFRGEDPFHLGVSAHHGEHLIAYVDLNGDQLTVIPFVHTGHSYFQVACILIRIPAGRDVEPCVEAWNHCDPNDSDNGDNVGADPQSIPFEDFPYVPSPP